MSVHPAHGGSSFAAYPDTLGCTKQLDTAVWINVLDDVNDPPTNDIRGAECVSDSRANPITKIINDCLERDQASHEDYCQNVRYIFDKVLKDCYDKRDLLGLACVATCKVPDVHKRAITLLELSLLKTGPCSNHFGVDTLNVISRHLATAMTAMSSQVRSQTLNVLLMVLSTKAMVFTRESNPGQWESLTKELKTLKSCLQDEEMKIFLKFADKPVKGMMESVQSFIQSEDPCAEKLWGKEKPIQFAVVQECLKQIFLHRDGTTFAFLKKYVVLLTKKKGRFCIELILFGLTLFLTHVFRDSSSDIKDCCCAGLNVIDEALKMQQPDWILNLMKQLLFSNLPLIRIRANGFLVRKFTESWEALLFEEVLHRLCPLLERDSNSKIPVTDNDKWLHVQGHFNGQNAEVLLHKSKDNPNWHNEAKTLQEPRNKRHWNAVNILQVLKHSSIMKMFAFQMDRIPQFYVLEFGQSLQEIMKNLNENNGYMNFNDLLNYLIDCAGAVEYCHDQQILHCNLTSACLFLVGNVMKLGSFELAVEVTDKEPEKIVECNMDYIPIRWSAPETLRGSKFSKSTDIWMLGVLIFEVLSHGALPYSHLGISEPELVWRLYPQVTCEKAKLCHEQCIKPEHFELITKCANMQPERRPSISRVKNQLSGLKKKLLNQRSQLNFGQNWTHSRSYSTDVHRGMPTGDVKCGKVDNSSIVSDNKEEKRTIIKTKYGHVIKQMQRHVIAEDLHGLIARVLPCLFFEKAKAGGDYENASAVKGYFTTQSHFQGSEVQDFLSVAKDRRFGKDLHAYKYMNLLLQVCEQIAELHKVNLVLGDFKPPDFFLDPCSRHPKIYTVCVKNLQSCNQTMDAETTEYANAYDKSDLCAADIYFFGRLVKDIFQALGIQVCNKNMSKQRRSRPHTCCHYLFELATLCMDEDKAKRPSLAKMIAEIKMLAVDPGQGGNKGTGGYSSDERSDSPLSSDESPYESVDLSKKQEPSKYGVICDPDDLSKHPQALIPRNPSENSSDEDCRNLQTSGDARNKPVPPPKPRSTQQCGRISRLKLYSDSEQIGQRCCVFVDRTEDGYINLTTSEVDIERQIVSETSPAPSYK